MVHGTPTGRFSSFLTSLARLAEKRLQEVVEIAEPGPLGSGALRWEHGRRRAAEAAVERALDNWRALQQRLSER